MAVSMCGYCGLAHEAARHELCMRAGAAKAGVAAMERDKDCERISRIKRDIDRLSLELRERGASEGGYGEARVLLVDAAEAMAAAWRKLAGR